MQLWNDTNLGSLWACPMDKCEYEGNGPSGVPAADSDWDCSAEATYVMLCQAQISHSSIPLIIEKPQRGRKMAQLGKAFAPKSENPEFPGAHMN